MMASVSSLHPGKLLLFTSLSAADLCITGALLRDGGGSIYEGNPIANAWLYSYGWTGLVIFKVVAMAIVIATCAYISLSHPRAGGLVLAFACTIVAAVVLYSCTLSRFGPHVGLRVGPNTVYRNSDWPVV
jgi:hypothetical protein